MYLWHCNIDILTYRTLSFHVHISPSHKYCYIWHYYFVIIHHQYTDTLLHWRSPFHIVVSSLREYYVHNYFMFLHHCYIDSLVYMYWLFLYSHCMDHRSYYMDYYYMDILVFLLHDYFLLLISIWYSCYWIWVLMICDV